MTMIETVFVSLSMSQAMLSSDFKTWYTLKYGKECLVITTLESVCWGSGKAHLMLIL